jgi:hypothetical protein
MRFVVQRKEPLDRHFEEWAQWERFFAQEKPRRLP